VDVDMTAAQALPADYNRRHGCKATVTQVRLRPWVVDGRVEPRPIRRLCGTFDHRVIDGDHAAEIPAEVERLLARPERLLTTAEQGTAGETVPKTR
jgi:pyruvate/2-oxoglutarate dehydrogenase complex dihydrolipoamide acyltransferase (E2) component